VIFSPIISNVFLYRSIIPRLLFKVKNRQFAYSLEGALEKKKIHLFCNE